MSFITLAERFEQRSKDIYNKFSPSGFQYVTVKPDTDGVFGSRSRIKNDNRSVPTVSVLRDTQRVSKFLGSADGRLFIAKQALLQTGNTFVDTKLYNPVSPLANVVPFLHVRRNIVQSLLREPTPGLLQNSTVNTISSKFEIRTSGQIRDLSKLDTSRRTLVPAIRNIAKSYLSTQLKNVTNAILPISPTYVTSRPEYKSFAITGPMIFDPQPLSQRNIPRLSLVANIKSEVTSNIRNAITNRVTNKLTSLLPKSLRNKVPTITNIPSNNFSVPKNPSFEGAKKSFIDGFSKNLPNEIKNEPSTLIYKNKYFDEAVPTSFIAGHGNEYIKNNRTLLKDPYHETNPIKAPVQLTDKINYNNIIKNQSTHSDIIKFIFRDADNGNAVHFRALISTIKESIKTEFNEQRYVGRVERFVTYGGAKRGLSLSFNIVAFSQDEIDGMWTRVNYLSGLAFPKKAEKGFMVPPLFKLTVGKLYDNQPCYIESLDYDFLDETITFDTIKEVPFAINVTMQLSILEKRSKFHDSPFYKITEEVSEEQRKVNAQRQLGLALFNRF